ncbi:MAG TPA: DoxX family protein [Anaerolineales bacterium]|nr:DoxX family protein [Anaerolineales bacterium]
MENKRTMLDKLQLDNLGVVGMWISRIIYGYLWYTQLLWKMPPRFGCPPDLAVTTDIHARSTGLCDWVGVMTIYSKWPLQASLVKQFVVPNMAWFGWIVWLMEAFVAVTLIFGLFTRLGGLAALVQGINLYIGVTAAPFEWYWTYGMLYTLGLVFLAVPTGRTLGLDALLRPRLQSSVDKGNRIAKILLFFT